MFAKFLLLGFIARKDKKSRKCKLGLSFKQLSTAVNPMSNLSVKASNQRLHANLKRLKIPVLKKSAPISPKYAVLDLLSCFKCQRHNVSII